MTIEEANEKIAEMEAKINELQEQLTNRALAERLAAGADELDEEQREFHKNTMARLHQAHAELLNQLTNKAGSVQLGPQAKKVVSIMMGNPVLVPRIREFAEDIVTEVTEAIKPIITPTRPFEPEEEEK